MRDLEQNTSAVPSAGIATYRPAMRQIFKNLQSFANNIMGFIAFHIDNKPDSTRVFFKRGIVEALPIWESVEVHAFKILNNGPWCQSFFP